MTVPGTLLLLFTIALPVHAQITFERSYGGVENDVAYALQKTLDRGYVIVGGTQSFGAGGWDVYLVKSDSLGDTLWTKSYPVGADDQGYAVRGTSDGGYIISGTAALNDALNVRDVFLIKTDSTGDTLWTRRFGGLYDDQGYALVKAPDGGYVIAGSRWQEGKYEDILLMKVNSLGDTLWTRTFGGTGFDEAYAAAQTQDGGYVLTGSSYSFSDSVPSLFLIKVDSVGDLLWISSCGGVGRTGGYAIDVTSDEGFIIAGTSAAAGTFHKHLYLVRTDPSGDTLWTKTLDGEGLEKGFAVKQTADHGYIITGTSKPTGASPTGLFLLKCDSTGEQMWIRTFSGTADISGRDVEQTDDGGYVVGGFTFSMGAGGADVYLIKTNGEGVVTSIQGDVHTLSPSNYHLAQNFPNPFNPSTKISFDLPTGGFVSIIVYDQLGREVKRLVHEVKEAGKHVVTWEAGNATSGVYYYRLISGQLVETRRMLVVR